MKPTITAIQLQDMAQHWLATPACAYLGSTYGQNVAVLLQQPMGEGNGADEVIAKLRADIALLAALPPETIHLYATDLGNQQQRLLLDIAGQALPVTMGTR